MFKKNTWYKVFYSFTAYDGNDYTTFEYAMNNVEDIINKHKKQGNYIDCKEWTM